MLPKRVDAELGPESQRSNLIVMTRESDAEMDLTLRYFLSLDTPEGYRAELIDGEIAVTPPPNGNHERCIMQIVKQVLANSVTPMNFSGHALDASIRRGHGRRDHLVIA